MFAGSPLTYALTVTNDGTGLATGVNLTDTLPSGVMFFSATDGVRPVSGVLTFSIGDLDAGASASFTIVVAASAAGTLVDSAGVSMDQVDPTPVDNSASVQTTVADAADTADLALSGSAPRNVALGNDVNYTLTVTNGGPASATGVVLIDTLPAGVTFRSATGGARPVNGVLTFTVGNLAVDASKSFTIVVTPLAEGRLSNRVTVSMDQTDPTPDDNSLTLTTQVYSVTMTGGCSRQPSALMLRSAEPLDPAWARNPRNYRLAPLEDPHRLIRLRSARYDAATNTVTLRPIHKFNVHTLFRLTVMGEWTRGVTDTAGNQAVSENEPSGPYGGFSTIITVADLVVTSKNPVFLRKYDWTLAEQSAKLTRLASRGLVGAGRL